MFRPPKCKSENITGGNIEIDYDVWQEVRCEDCEYEWNEVYTYFRAETPDTCEEIDEDGNIIKNIILEPAKEGKNGSI